MASGLDSVRAKNFANASVGSGSPDSFTGTPNTRLMGTMGSATSNGTELSMTGYTAGGFAQAYGTAGAGTESALTGPTATQSATNGSGSTASIPGMEIWDSAATKLRWWWGAFASTISLPNGSVIQIAANAITVEFP